MKPTKKQILEQLRRDYNPATYRVSIKEIIRRPEFHTTLVLYTITPVGNKLLMKRWNIKAIPDDPRVSGGWDLGTRTEERE